MIGVMKDMIPYESGEINIGVNDIIVCSLMEFLKLKM